MKILVTGGAGFIGSVVVERLVAEGHETHVADNLSTGHRQAVHPAASLHLGDILDREWVFSLMHEIPFDAVMHLAAVSVVSESQRDPSLYFRVNVAGGLNVLDAMAATGVRDLIFSSTAAVYGEPPGGVVEEDSPKAPVNAYGASKLAFEAALPWYGLSYGVRYISLRYFNACGATILNGEDRPHETHLIPIAVKAAKGELPALTLFGSDYDTPDGTCVRDYIHVMDIAEAHSAALRGLDRFSGRAYNVGTGTGVSNLDVIEAVKRVTETDFPVTVGARRSGDPARLVARSDAIVRDLGWSSKFSTLEHMIRSAFEWRSAHPAGYSAKRVAAPV